jgi:hypothetical protein
MVTLCNPNNVEIGIIDRDNIQDEFKITPTFNEVSKLSMKVYKNLGDTALPCYDKIKKRRQLFIDGFGYFTITEVKEADIGVNPYKDVEAYSCEFELSTINVPYIDGTYKFCDEVNQATSLMHTIMPYIPKWTLDIASIPSTIKNKSRTFEDVDDNIYKFLMTSVEETYGCVFEFDAINRIITVFDKDNYVNKTSVLLDDETVESIGIHENVDEMKTALKVTGGNDLDISYANPLGGIIIYDFHYYKDPEWMSQELIDALTAWENKLSGYESTYSDLVESLITKNNELITIETNLTSSEQLLEGYKKQKSAIIAENGNLSEINAAIATEQINHDGLLVQLTEKQAEISAVQGQCTAIQQDLSFSTNFTADQYAELTSYIDCGDYSDENITITTNMTDAEVIAQSVELYNQAKNQLSKISEPKYEFPIESKSFVFLKQFQPYTEQIETGCLIDVRLAEDDIASLILLSMSVDFIDGSCGFTFGNRYRLSNGCALLDGLTNSVVSSSKTVEKQKGNWNYVAKSDVVSEFQNFKNSALDLTKNAIISADGQSVEVRDDGIHIRRLVDGTPDPKELLITNGTIAFSDDNFNTSKLALGTITFPDSSTAYGLIAEAIYGNLLAGNKLTISNENGSVIIDGSGIDIYDGDITIYDGDGNKAFSIDPNEDTGVKNVVKIYGTLRSLAYPNLSTSIGQSETGASGAFLVTEVGLGDLFSIYGVVVGGTEKGVVWTSPFLNGTTNRKGINIQPDYIRLFADYNGVGKGVTVYSDTGNININGNEFNVNATSNLGTVNTGTANLGTTTVTGAFNVNSTAYPLIKFNKTNKTNTPQAEIYYNGDGVLNTLVLNVNDANPNDAISLKANNIYADGNLHCYNLSVNGASENVLWNGALYMIASQTITPSKSLSECTNGWILVWSDYDVDTLTAKDYNFVYNYVPKFAYQHSGSCGTYFMVPTSKTNTAHKYLYISNTQLTGSDDNVFIDTDANIDGSDAVLRYVLEW